MNVLAADRGEGISGRRSLLAALRVPGSMPEAASHRVAGWSIESGLVPCPAGSPIRTTWAAAGDMDEFCALARRTGPRQIRWWRRHRFRRLRNRCGSRGGCLPSVVPPRRLPRLRKTAVRGRGAVVINSYPALCMRSAGCSWSRM